MIGAIIGDMVGSIYEFDNIKHKDFLFFSDSMEPTDDSVLTIASADWLLHGGNVSEYYLRYANAYPERGYGGGFWTWVKRSNRGLGEPYYSCGNGCAMRVSPVGWFFDSEEETLDAAKRSAFVHIIILKVSKEHKLQLSLYFWHDTEELHKQ